MVKHIILWTLNPELSEEEKKNVKAGIKAGLEGLVGKVPGLLDVTVHIDESGNLTKKSFQTCLDTSLHLFLLFFREFWIQCPEDNVLNHNLNVLRVNIERE